MQVLSYGRSGALSGPNLFSRTRDFRFTGPGGSLVHRILEPGPRDFRVVAVASTGHSAGFVEKARVAVTVPRRGSAVVEVAGRRHMVRPGDLVALGPSERRSDLRPDASSRTYESFTVIASPDWGVRLREESLLRPPSDHGRRLIGLLEYAFAFPGGAFDRSDRARLLGEALIEETVTDALLSDDQGAPASSASHFESVSRLACEFMQESHGQPITVSDVASATGVGVRTLQRAFRQCRGASVRGHLTELRLARMRQLLETGAPGTTVTSAAIDAGLFHLGRCSAAYRGRYGELPSQTLRRWARGG